MITLYRNESDSAADRIEEKLQDLVLSYHSKKLSPDEQQLYIDDGGNKIIGDENIEKWFIQLQSELKWQRSLSGDGCYIDPETGETC